MTPLPPLPALQIIASRLPNGLIGLTLNHMHVAIATHALTENDAFEVIHALTQAVLKGMPRTAPGYPVSDKPADPLSNVIPLPTRDTRKPD